MQRRKKRSVWQTMTLALIGCATLSLLVAVATGLSARAPPSFGTVVSLGGLVLIAAITLYTSGGRARLVALCLIYSYAALSTVNLIATLVSQ